MKGGTDKPFLLPLGTTSPGPRLSQPVHVEVCFVGSQLGVPVSSRGHNEYSHQPTHMSPQYSHLHIEPASLTEPDIRWANKQEGETICVAKEFLTLKSHVIPFKCHLPQSLLTDH